MQKKFPLKRIFRLIPILISFVACTSIGTFEKNLPLPENKWPLNYIPELNFNVEDTVATYNMYVVVRHTDAYRYNNLWINLYTAIPGGKENRQRFDLRLATDDKGWLGSGMDDIWEHRIFISPVRFPKKGNYRFRFENIMREDPLEHILNIGLRVEKAQ